MRGKLFLIILGTIFSISAAANGCKFHSGRSPGAIDQLLQDNQALFNELPQKYLTYSCLDYLKEKDSFAKFFVSSIEERFETDYKSFCRNLKDMEYHTDFDSQAQKSFISLADFGRLVDDIYLEYQE